MLQTHVVAILDDDAPVREALAELLEVAGIAAQTFDSPKAFLSVYDLSRFACVITDVKMPGISGIELLEHLRALHDDVPVIVITSATDPHTRRRAFRAGAFSILAKPIAGQLLLADLKSAMGGGETPERSDAPEQSPRS
ncbi:response regulator [Novosphingobium sp. ST904]|uniref:response regulator transcription factor n=1 Tax=Novosphingobium sp. ST904 TaxID=1684385 RepID=UPI0006C83495|nr:response regulator [Novosphingobium sp. ST904]KPH64082.1 hypothetical protein ADT71_12430 [Novosphingobium sp. ST904]TCM32421.1 response regulator receiver domain-containing protein [Novosphingobium sp. ST904]